MVIITANEAVQAALAGIAEKAEIRDAAGKLIGYFEPRDESSPTPEEIKKLLDDDKLRDVEASGGPYYTTTEVLRRLNSLGNP